MKEAPGRRRYLNWAERERWRLQTIAEQQAALSAVAGERIVPPADRARDRAAPRNNKSYPQPLTARQLIESLRQRPQWVKLPMIELGAIAQKLGVSGRGSRKELVKHIKEMLT